MLVALEEAVDRYTNACKETFVARRRHESSNETSLARIKEDNCQTFQQLFSCHHQWLIQKQMRCLLKYTGVPRKKGGF